MPPIEVISLQSDDVPEDFVCAVCLSIPVDPWVVKECHHVFCKDCLQQCLQQQEQCPVCRIDTHSMEPMCTANPLAHRIWSRINVKCQHHTKGCTWTGSISDCVPHTFACQRRNCKPIRTTNNLSALIQQTTDRETIRTLQKSVRKHQKYVRKLLVEAEEKDRTIGRNDKTLRAMKVSFQALSIDAKMKDRGIKKLCAEAEKKDQRYRALEKQTREKLESIRDTKSTALDTKCSKTINGPPIFVDYNIGDRFMVLAQDSKKALQYEEQPGPFTVTQVHTNGTISFLRRNNVMERINVRKIEPYYGSIGDSNPADSGKDDVEDPSIGATAVVRTTAKTAVKAPKAATTGAPAEPYFLIVANGTVVHHSADLEDNKKYLMTKYVRGANRPSRMIVEVSAGGNVAEDPHTVGGQNQGGGIHAGFNKWWWNWNDIRKMTAVAERYLSQQTKAVQPHMNDNFLKAFNVKGYKDVEIQTYDGSWIHRENMRKIFVDYNIGDQFMLLAEDPTKTLQYGELGPFTVTQVISFLRRNNVTERINIRRIEADCGQA